MNHSLKIMAASLFIMTTMSCKKPKIEPLPLVTTCDFVTLIESSSKSYAFGETLSDHFIQTERWESENAILSQINDQMELSASGTDISEVWLTHSQQLPYNISWEFSIKALIPVAWNSASGNEPQIGVGIFVGKPEPSGQSKKVYECNLAVVGNGERFVQGQLVANRLGEDPIAVDQKILANNLEQVQLKLQYCSSSHTLSLFADDEMIGIQAIDASGPDNWVLSSTSMMDFGIMGFAENTNITSDFPVIDDFELKIY